MMGPTNGSQGRCFVPLEGNNYLSGEFVSCPAFRRFSKLSWEKWRFCKCDESKDVRNLRNRRIELVLSRDYPKRVVRRVSSVIM